MIHSIESFIRENDKIVRDPHLSTESGLERSPNFGVYWFPKGGSKGKVFAEKSVIDDIKIYSLVFDDG